MLEPVGAYFDKHGNRPSMVYIGSGALLLLIAWLMYLLFQAASILGMDALICHPCAWWAGWTTGVAGAIVLLVGVALHHRDRPHRHPNQIPKLYRPRLDSPTLSFSVNQNCYVLQGIKWEEYSEIAADYVTRTHVTKVVSICTMDPSGLLALIAPKVGEFGAVAPDEEKLAKMKAAETLLSAADERLRHFKTFREAQAKVTRIFVVNDPGWAKRNQEHVLTYFDSIGGEVPCFVVTADKLNDKQILFRGEHMIVDRRLVLDYNTDSQTLIITYLAAEPMNDDGKHLLALGDYFDVCRTRGSNHFRPLHAFVNGA